MTATCVECGELSDRPRAIDGAYLCWSCIEEVCDGCSPEWISRGDGSAVYWWHCICDRAVRRGAYKVPPELRGAGHHVHALVFQGIADAGVMLCRACVTAAAAAEIPAEILQFRPRGGGRSKEVRDGQ